MYGATVFIAMLLLSIGGAAAPLDRAGGDGLLIVVSFPNLVNDLKLLICSGDRVVSIAPAGVDPHEYHLTPGDIEVISNADLVISTGHAPFETRLRELAEEGAIRGVLVEIPRIRGIRIRDNPVTHQPNLHMPIYDPFNYVVFINNITSILKTLRPECSAYYEERRQYIIESITEILEDTRRIYTIAVADKPVTQYAVEWLGINIEYLLIKEHGAPATPQDIKVIRKGIEDDVIGLAVVTSPPSDQASMTLLSIAEEYGLPVLYVPSPLSNASILEKLANISRQASELSSSLNTGAGRCGATVYSAPWYSSYVILAMVVSSIAVFILYISRRGVDGI